MSLCNTFRLFVVSLVIVLSAIDTPAAFTLDRTTGGEEPSRDLAKEESIIVERKTIEPDIKTNIKARRKNSVNLRLKLTNASKENNEANTTTDESIITSTFDNTPSNTFETTTEFLTTIKDTSNEIKATKSNKNKTLSKRIKDNETTTAINSASNVMQNKFIKSEITTETTTLGEVTTLKYDDTETTTSFESDKLPIRKKYYTIDRKRHPVKSNIVKSYSKKERMSKSETKHSRVSLKDAVTSDIPSLEQLKNDLLYSISKEQTADFTDDPLILSTTDVNKSYETTTLNPISSTEEIISSTRWETVQSKRAGYLDLSDNIKNYETLTAKETSDFKFNPQVTLRTMFELDNIESDMPEEQSGSGAKSQGQLNDDTIKEELLKEKIISENEQNVKRIDIKDTISNSEALNSTEQVNSSSEEKLSVRPINSDKIKNISLYSVSPNYKPLKKIEVQAPKQFVRDPDDNTWRNESLNSLGIVFKSNNSSKPFTQVLKNKTEAELNSLTEKNTKNDIPDLKERLQKMAERRKSKRKKTDSLGNVVYFDYEENSSSRENISKDELLPAVSALDTATNIDKISNSSETPPSLITTSMMSTTDKKLDRIGNRFRMNKFKNFFNIPEYYDTTEDEDEDYLDMAKIDIKKFSTSSKTTPTTAITPRAWGINRFASTISPERKATIQYFPPLTTQKVSFNDYDNNFKFKVNSYKTNTEQPKNVVPVTLSTPRVPDTTFQYKHLSSENPNNFVITNKPNFDKNFYSTQPPQTTQTAYTLLNEDGSFDRDSYVVKHYKDFINEAAKANDFDKNLEYIPYTQSPEKETTKAELTKYVTEKAKVNMDQDYDYESHFRKDVLQRFVDNFNENSERFKSDFPVLFNSSIIHSDSGRDVASSRAFMRGLYNTDIKPKPPAKTNEDPNDNITVELSPSYELHYYMPDQEEKEEVVQQPVTLPYQYRL